MIADDLTGACDAAVHFAMRGRETVVSLGVETAPPETDVVAVSAGSRELGPEELKALMDEAARRLPVASAGILFKKIDSTLRGNVGAEIAAAVEAFGCEAAVITPAFPALNRVVEAGFLRVTAGAAFVPIEVARRLRWQGAEPCSHVPPGAVAEALETGARFISLEATCDEDLDAIAAEGLALGKRLLWAGSGGLASALARKLAPRYRAPCEIPLREGAVLFCLGSDHPATLEQQERVLAERPGHPVLRVPRGALTEEKIRELVQAEPVRALVLSGGDTAAVVCRALGAKRIRLCDEILPGIPRGVLIGGLADGLPVATKAGGFGEPDALIRVADHFSHSTP